MDKSKNNTMDKSQVIMNIFNKLQKLPLKKSTKYIGENLNQYFNNTTEYVAGLLNQDSKITKSNNSLINAHKIRGYTKTYVMTAIEYYLSPERKNNEINTKFEYETHRGDIKHNYDTRRGLSILREYAIEYPTDFRMIFDEQFHKFIIGFTSKFLEAVNNKEYKKSIIIKN